jgi:tetratricopeptide (TPR) repeat protein
VADRYAYLASLPLVVVAAAGIVRVLRGWARRPAVRLLLGLAALGLLGTLGTLSWIQCGVWRTSTSLWLNASALTGGQSLEIEENLAASFIDEDQPHRGAALLRRILARDPNRPMLHFNLGIYDVLVGRDEEAKRHFEAAIRGLSEESPYLAEAHYNLGVILERSGRLKEALAAYEEAARLNPHDASTRNNLGSVLYQMGDYAGAEARFSEALQLDPGHRLARQGREAARRMRAGPGRVLDLGRGLLP